MKATGFRNTACLAATNQELCKTRSGSRDRAKSERVVVPGSLSLITLESQSQGEARCSKAFCLDGRPSLRTVNVPKGVMVNGFRISGDRIAVHLLNAVGGEVRPGMEFTHASVQKIQFPEVRSTAAGKPMSLSIAEKIAKAHLVSPDFEGQAPAAVRQIDDGYSSVEIPGLKRYSILVLEK